MQALFIHDNPVKSWLIERLNDGIPVGRDDEVVIPWFCQTFGIEVCIYWLESHSEYERVEFLSPRIGMIVNIYQRQNEFETETGLLYFANYNEEALEPTYPNCCQAFQIRIWETRWNSKCSENQSFIHRRSNRHFKPTEPRSLQTVWARDPSAFNYIGAKETIVGFPVIHIRVPPQAIARLKSNLQEKGLSPDEATRYINSGHSSRKQLKLEPPQLIRTERGGVVPKLGIDCLDESEELSERHAGPTLTRFTQLTSLNTSVEGGSSGISSVSMRASHPIRPIKTVKAASSLAFQPAKSQTSIRLRLSEQVKAEENKTSDPVTRSLLPRRVRIVPRKICSSCQKNLTGISYECSAKCKVCVQCLVMSALPAKTCPGCKQTTLRQEDVNFIEKLRPN
jgi:hypothetical protein